MSCVLITFDSRLLSVLYGMKLFLLMKQSFSLSSLLSHSSTCVRASASAAFQKESSEQRLEEDDGGGRAGSRSLWRQAFQQVRDQPGGPQQLTAVVCLSLVRTLMVSGAAADGKWS